MNNKKLQFWAPWVLLVIILVVWQTICTVFKVSEFIFPSPLRIANQTWEFKEVILGHAWRTYWVTMAGCLSKRPVVHNARYSWRSSGVQPVLMFRNASTYVSCSS